MTKVVRLRRKDGKVVQDCDVYIGRRLTMGGWRLDASIWANPFTIGRDGNRAEVIRKYRAHVLSRGDLMERLHDLYGHRLGCWCSPDPCHGDVLVELAEKDHKVRGARARESAVAVVPPPAPRPAPAPEPKPPVLTDAEVEALLAPFM